MRRIPSHRVGAMAGLAAVLTGIAGPAVARSSSRPVRTHATPAFATGVYSGRTSQGMPFAFAVRVVRGCGRRGALCLYTTTQAYLPMPCSDGSATNAYADPGPAVVPRSGVIRAHSTLFWDVGATIKLSHGGTAGGHFWALGTLPSGADCGSGTVTFTARRTHA